MKKFVNIFICLSIAVMSVLAWGCSDMFEEIDSIALNRCLEPTELNARVSATKGNVVTFSWNVGKDAESYNLVICTDKELSEIYAEKSITPDQVPFTMTVDADATYYYKVQAVSSTKESSHWVTYTDDSKAAKSIKTFAVKDNLFLAVAERGSSTMKLSWSKEVEDYQDVTHVTYGAPGASEESLGKYTLTAEDIASASATIPQLQASHEYVFTLYYLSAGRGEINAWTTPDMNGLTEVNTSAALEQAIKDGGNIALAMEGSPYTINASALESGLGVSKGFKVSGIGGPDGSRPEIIGTISINNDFDGGDIYFEGVKFSGNGNSCGFALQRMNDNGITTPIPVNSITYKNCEITGYSKGLFYEWGKTFAIKEFKYESTDIYAINADGTGGGDGFDLRGATSIDKFVFNNCTIYNGFRTFIRVDAAGVMGDIDFSNNTLMNLCFVDNANNGGVFGLQVAPKSFTIKKNLFLNFVDKATLEGANTKYIPAADLAISASENWFYNCVETFSTTNMTVANLGGATLSADPCYNAKAGLFNINPDSEIAGKQIGASKWWTPYVEQPENLSLYTLGASHTWDLNNAKFFSGTSKKQMVRDSLFISASENLPISFADGKLTFSGATVCNKKGLPTDGYLYFKVNKPGSIVLCPTDGLTSHVIVGTVVEGEQTITVKGGASPLTDMGNNQKIVIKDITGETLVYVYASGPVSLSQIAWSTDISDVNTALPAPEPKTDPSTVTAGEPVDINVSWSAVPNAASYSVVFGGKTYAVDEGLSYTIASSVVGMLDPGSYTVNVFANPGEKDIYNTMSNAGTAAFAVQPAGGSTETSVFMVSSVEELLNAISAGKDAITLKYKDTPYEIGALTLTAPLHLTGQTEGGKKTPISASFTLSGNIKGDGHGSVVLNNLDITNESQSVIFEDKTGEAPTVDTVAIVDCYIHGTKALYDNSGKAASDAQVIIIKGNHIDNCSTGADFIDLRNGAHHTVKIIGNTFANSCRTFFRTDAAHEMNYLTVMNNTFYKVATNSSSKDNNGIFHVRSAAGAGLLEYKVISNIFYSILIDSDPSNANGFPKFRSKTGLNPSTVVNNYFYNCEDREEKAAYSFWSFFEKEAAIAGGGAILPADPFKNAEGGDYTLTNGVAMNANVGDPRWNPALGGNPTSEITVNNTDEFLTAISAGKSTITLADGEYDLTTIEGNPDITGGKLTIASSLNLKGSKNAVLAGGFVFGEGVENFTISGITLTGKGAVDNAFATSGSSNIRTISFNDVAINQFKNRLIYQSSETASVASLAFNKVIVTQMGTSGDCIDFRKGTLSALKIQNSTFANGIRTLMRIDASVNCNSVNVTNNTFYNLCSVDSKDNNGIFHIRSTTATSANQIIVRNNIFASMHKAAETPSNANGFPKLVSSTSSAIANPSFSHNYYYDIDETEGYSWWNKTEKDLCLAGYGMILTEQPFKDPANGDFTLVNALAASENIGDPRWNTTRPSMPGASFEVADVDAMLTAISAGKTDLLLTGSMYDFTASADASISGGVLSVNTGLTLNGRLSHGEKPTVIGGFKVYATEGGVVLNNLKLQGTKEADGNKTTIGNMLDIDASAVLEKIVIRNCDINAYGNRFIYGSGTSVCGPIQIVGNIVTNHGTGGDFIDIRKGTVSSIKVVSNTFANGIRTFLRCDAAVDCGAVNIENNTFYNLGYVDSKDNNGILHIRSTKATSTPRQIIVKKNIFAAMHRAVETPSNAAAGFPHLISKASSAIAVPVITDNIFYDIDDHESYGWWMYLPAENEDAKKTVITESPFAGDPTTGKYTVISKYKGYGDLRW